MAIREKVSLKNSSVDNYYLPPISDVYQYLGTKYDIVTAIELSEAKGMEVPKISRSSKYALRGKGVGHNTFQNILNWLSTTIDITSLERRLEGTLLARSLKAESNAARYLAAIESLSLNRDINAFTPLIQFIEQRCRSDIEFAEDTRNKIKAGNLDPTNNLSYFWQEHEKPFWLANTTLPLSVLNSLDHAITDNEPDLTDTQLIDIFHPYIKRRFDFHLSVIANYEVSCFINQNPNCDDIGFHRTMLNKAITSYAHSDSETCFGYFLLEFKSWLEKRDNKNISWRQIARYIEVDPNSDDNSRIDKQCNRLKDWKRGKNTPSNKLLCQFITNAAEDRKTFSADFSLFIFFRIALGLDNSLRDLSKQFSNEFNKESEIKSAWKNVLSHYDAYFLYYLNQHITKIEKMT